MKIEIDPKSGFCFGVVNAIKMAEQELESEENLFCLGDIVHNEKEVSRLNTLGLRTIDHEALKKLYNTKLLIRAHGEPPSTYRIAHNNNINLIDATCPVVLNLQRRIREIYEQKGDGITIVIYGKKGHAEVNGLVGQTNGKAFVVESPNDVTKQIWTKPVFLFSQTTKTNEGFQQVINQFEKIENLNLEVFKTVCKQVSNRVPELICFVKKYDTIIFVSGKKSSNGNMLYRICKKENANTFFISDIDDLKQISFVSDKSVGVCGANSTPRWLMVEVVEKIKLQTGTK